MQEKYNLDLYDIDALKRMRILLLSQHVAEKDKVVKMRIGLKITAVRKELYSRTEEEIYK